MSLEVEMINLIKAHVDLVDDYLEVMNNCSKACYENTGGQATYTKDQLMTYLEKITHDDSRLDYFMMLDGRIVGEVVLNDLTEDSGHIRLAIFQESDFSKGYGSFAMKSLMNKGFKELGLHRIDLEVYDFNTRAIKLYEKLGFVKEGVLRDAYKNEKYHDIIIMAILEDEFKG